MRLSYTMSKSGVGIPYPAVDRPDGKNHGYFDLKRTPELIDNVPELQDVPELRSLVMELNHSRSVVRSVSCEKSLSPTPHAEINFKLTSFVGMCFEILVWNASQDNYRKMFDMLDEGCQASKTLLSDLIQIEFEVCPASFNDHHGVGWMVMLWNHGFGRCEAESKENWAIGVRLLVSFR